MTAKDATLAIAKKKDEKHIRGNLGFGYAVFMRAHWHSSERDGFTLAELLTVIVLIGIMLAFVLPAFVDITGQSKLDGAANAVHSALNMARQYAATYKQPTYLVFNEGQTDPSLAYRAYAVFTIDIHTNLTSVPREAGVFLTNWETLPDGVVFDDVVGSSSNVYTCTTTDPWNGAIGKNNRLKIGNQQPPFAVLGFTPEGEAGSDTHWIYLTEGFISDALPTITGTGGRRIETETTGRSIILDYLYGNDSIRKPVE